MTFLVDAQLPARLAAALVKAGHDAIHTGELPDGNRTTDARIAAIADRTAGSWSPRTATSGTVI